MEGGSRGAGGGGQAAGGRGNGKCPWMNVDFFLE